MCKATPRRNKTAHPPCGHAPHFFMCSNRQPATHSTYSIFHGQYRFKSISHYKYCMQRPSETSIFQTALLFPLSVYCLLLPLWRHGVLPDCWLGGGACCKSRYGSDKKWVCCCANPRFNPPLQGRAAIASGSPKLVLSIAAGAAGGQGGAR